MAVTAWRLNRTGISMKIASEMRPRNPLMTATSFVRTDQRENRFTGGGPPPREARSFDHLRELQELRAEVGPLGQRGLAVDQDPRVTSLRREADRQSGLDVGRNSRERQDLPRPAERDDRVEVEAGKRAHVQDVGIRPCEFGREIRGIRAIHETDED